jgi:hypothetical protein
MTPHSKIPENITDTNQLRSMARRRGIKLSTRSQPQKNSSVVLESVASEVSGDPGQEHSNLSQPTPRTKTNIPLEDPDKPSTDLRRHPRGIIRWAKLLPGRIKRYWLILRPPLTPEQMEQREFEKLERYRDRLCKREARKYMHILSRKLGQLGEREIIGNNTEGKPRKLRLVRWTGIARDELFTKIILRMDTDPAHLPSYVRVSDLGRREYYADEMLPTLAHYMEFKSDEAGVFAIIYRKGLDGLPEFVAAEDIWRKMPENKPPLTFPVGYGDNSTRMDIDLDDCPHLLVGGATKQGKSNFINNILCFWLHRGLTPQDFQLVLFDLKRGMEFCFYEGLPHLYHDEEDVIAFEKQKVQEADDDKQTYEPKIIETGIIEDLVDVVPAMLRLRKIMDQRLGHIKNAGHKDFNAFNNAQHSSQKKLPALVVVFDEWARIRLSLGGGPEVMLAEMTNIARAAGMYFILGTQNPNSTVISSLISVNFSTRIIFKCSVGGSMASLGNQAAVGLEEKGRAILQDGGDQFKLQTPRISDGLIKAIVFKAITGKDKKSFSPIDLEEILQHSLNHFDGALDVSKLFAVFREKKVKWEWLVDALRDAEGKEFELGGTPYRVMPAGYHKGRRLERTDTDTVSAKIANSKSQI